MKPLRALILLVALTPSLSADPFSLDATTLRKLSRPAPFGTDLGSTNIKFRLPDGLRFVTEDKLQDFADRMKLAIVGDEVGVVVPDDMGWYTMIYLLKEKDDPLAGQTDLANLNRESLATWHDKFTSDHTPRRNGNGKTWRLGNWTHPPTWDAEKKILTMGVRMSADGDASTDLINYKLFLYGPDKQIVCLQCIAPTADAKYEKPVNRTQKLVEEITFPQSAGELNPNDEMVYYGKLAGGGLLGAFIVILAARTIVGGRRAAGSSAIRRQGLPR